MELLQRSAIGQAPTATDTDEGMELEPLYSLKKLPTAKACIGEYHPLITLP
jgi:hypothetical protein